MQLPIVKPAPIVTTHAQAFRHLFDNQCQFRHFQNYLTGLMVLENKSLANISRCILDSAAYVQSVSVSLSGILGERENKSATHRVSVNSDKLSIGAQPKNLTCS